MQQFLLNEKVITELHMQKVQLKQRTKFAKKYDLPLKTSTSPPYSKQIQHLLQLQRKSLSKPKVDDSHQTSSKTKHLLSSLNFLKTHRNQTQNSSKNVLMQNYFTFRGLRKQAIKSKQNKKVIFRTCSLVSGMKMKQNSVTPYDFNSDLLFQRSPQCFISPQENRTKSKNNTTNHLPNQTQSLTSVQHSNSRIQSKKPISITEMVGKQLQEQLKRRKVNNRTAPQKHKAKTKSQQNLFNLDFGLFEEDISKMETKIYTEIRENKQKLIRRNKERVGVNIEKNKPFGEIEINKNTGKLLKKYHCGELAYFQKFIPKD